MRKFLVILLLMFSVSMSAQQLIATSAKITQGISWTVGEMITETIIGSDFASIQGFNHPQKEIPPFAVNVEALKSVLEFSFYPNPVGNELTIDCKDCGGYFWRIVNLLGQEVASGQSFVANTIINMGTYAPGNYLLTVTSSQDIKSVIIIKK